MHSKLTSPTVNPSTPQISNWINKIVEQSTRKQIKFALKKVKIENQIANFSLKREKPLFWCSFWNILTKKSRFLTRALS